MYNKVSVMGLWLVVKDRVIDDVACDIGEHTRSVLTTSTVLLAPDSEKTLEIWRVLDYERA